MVNLMITTWYIQRSNSAFKQLDDKHTHASQGEQNQPTWIVWASGKALKACEFIVPADVPEEVPF